MSELVQRRDDDAETVDRLAEAERQLDLAAERVSDPFDLHRLKEAQFTIWEIRTELEG